MRIHSLILALLVVGLIVGCGETENNSGSARSESQNLPDQVMTNSEIYLTSGGIRKATVKSESLKVYARIDTTLLYDVTMLFFDSTGNLTSTLTSDSARVSQHSNSMAAFGHVKARTNDNRRLIADSLRWDTKTEKIMTEGYVEIYRNDDKISGYGLETDQRLRETVIKRNPKGTFSEPEKRNP